MQIKPIEKPVCIDALCYATYNIHEPGYIFTGHLHNSWELVYVKKGSAIASTDEKVFTLKQGHLLFHKPLQFHQIMTNGNENVELLILDFIASGPDMEKFAGKVYSLSKSEYKEYYSAFINLSEAGNYYKTKDTHPEYGIYSTKAANELELFLLKMLNKKPHNEITLPPAAEYYKKIISVMTENCEKNLTIDNIAAICNMSRSNLKRVFGMYNSVGIAKYMLTLKIQRAAEMLKENTSIAQIAKALNFSSPHYFQTVFKREVGITPGQYRKDFLKK